MTSDGVLIEASRSVNDEVMTALKVHRVALTTQSVVGHLARQRDLADMASQVEAAR